VGDEYMFATQGSCNHSATAPQAGLTYLATPMWNRSDPRRMTKISKLAEAPNYQQQAVVRQQAL
jgi:hypothetical protein